MTTTTAQPRSYVRLGRVVGLGTGWFVVAVLLLHALKSDDYDFSAQTISEFAVGRYGYLMTSAFVALGVAELTLAIALWRATGSRVGPALQLVGAFVDLTSAVFEADLLGSPGTTHGAIHDGVGALGALLVIPTLLAYAWAFRRSADWRSFAGPTLGWAIAETAGLVLVILLGDKRSGTSERVFLAIYVSWLLAAALRLIRYGAAVDAQGSSS